MLIAAAGRAVAINHEGVLGRTLPQFADCNMPENSTSSTRNSPRHCGSSRKQSSKSGAWRLDCWVKSPGAVAMLLGLDAQTRSLPSRNQVPQRTSQLRPSAPLATRTGVANDPLGLCFLLALLYAFTGLVAPLVVVVHCSSSSGLC